MRPLPSLTIVAAAIAVIACGSEDLELADEPPAENIGDCAADESECTDDTPTDDEGLLSGYDSASKLSDVHTPEFTPGDEARNSRSTDEGTPDVGGDDDLQCADDPAICRFCGPPEGVVESCPPGDDAFECQVVELVNQHRVDAGLSPLDYDGTLAESAMIHAMDLAQCDYLAHDSLDGTTFFERCAENGYPGTCTGENLAGGQATPKDVVDAWMASPGHRDNILYEHHTEVGIAYHEGPGAYGRYWVKHFGRR